MHRLGFTSIFHNHRNLVWFLCDTLIIIGEIKTKTKPSPDVDLFHDIDLQIVSDFKAMRAKNKAPITKTAIDGIRREAETVGMSLGDALKICCERSWRGFKAEWILQHNRGSPAAPGPAAARYGRYRQRCTYRRGRHCPKA